MIDMSLIGKLVTIKSAKHPDVQPGTLGKVVCTYSGGYGVAIDGMWLVAGNDRGKRVKETRTVWYEEGQFESV